MTDRFPLPPASSLLALCGLALLVLLVPASPARGAGMTTHAWMADVGIDAAEDPELRELLDSQRMTVLSGASYPDSGYYAGAAYPPAGFGEVSHWGRFIDAYVAYIRSKPGCAGTLTEPDGPCAPLVAHLMGSAAHGMGDETWDWMFESQMPDHGEHPYDRNRVDDQPGWAELGTAPAGPELQAELLGLDDRTIGDDDHPVFGVVNSPEYNMDVAAINDYGRTFFDSLPPPAVDLEAVYRAIGRDDITADGITAAWAGITGVLAAERASVADAEGVRRDMPWSVANMTTSQGGVEHSGAMIAGYYESLWAKLTGDGPPPLEVVGTAPFDGSDDVPTDWAGAQTFAGPHGDGDKRIIAVVNNGLDPATDRYLPNAMRLLDGDGNEVEPRPGFPYTGPYGGDGVHSIAFFPAGDLEACETYTAEVTTALADHAGTRLAEPYRWSFTTRSADGSDCPEPTDPNECVPPGRSGGKGKADERGKCRRDGLKAGLTAR